MPYIQQSISVPFRVYESESGKLALAILNATDRFISVYTGFENHKGLLLDHLLEMGGGQYDFPDTPKRVFNVDESDIDTLDIFPDEPHYLTADNGAIYRLPTLDKKATESDLSALLESPVRYSVIEDNTSGNALHLVVYGVFGKIAYTDALEKLTPEAVEKFRSNISALKNLTYYEIQNVGKLPDMREHNVTFKEYFGIPSPDDWRVVIADNDGVYINKLGFMGLSVFSYLDVVKYDKILKHLREEQNHTLEDVSANILIDPDRLSAAENGSVALTSGELVDLANLYGVSVQGLMNGQVVRASDNFLEQKIAQTYAKIEALQSEIEKCNKEMQIHIKHLKDYNASIRQLSALEEKEKQKKVNSEAAEKAVKEEKEQQEEKEKDTLDLTAIGFVTTPRGGFDLVNVAKSQLEAAGYSYHHNSEDFKFMIMTNGKQAVAIPNTDWVDAPSFAKPEKLNIEDSVYLSPPKSKDIKTARWS